MPITLLYGDYTPGSYPFGASSIDLVDRGGLYGGQIVFSGWTDSSFATGAGGTFLLTATFNCPLSGNPPGCAPLVPFNQSIQGIIGAPSNPPFLVQATAVTVISFDVNPTNFSVMTAMAGDNSVALPFPPGFNFDFYGITYTSGFVSANGFISFGALDTGFPSPNVGIVRSGVPRIMAWYADLEPQFGASPQFNDPRVFAHSFFVGSQMCVRVVWENVAEFGDYSGPHGGEIAMFQNGDIFVFPSEYNQTNAFAAVVGITPGGNIDPGGLGVTGQTVFGRDLSLDVVNGPTFLGVNRIGFEVFTSNFYAPAFNVMDLSGFNYVPGLVPQNGIRFIKNPLVVGPGVAEYIVN